MGNGMRFAALIAVLAAGLGAFWLIGQRSPMVVDLPEAARSLEVANLKPGMRMQAAEAVVRSDGWSSGIVGAHRIVRSGMMRADRLYWRVTTDHVEALGLDFAQHPSGRWVTSVHYAVMSGGLSQASGGGAPGAVAAADDRHAQIVADLTEARGPAPFSRAREIDGWLTCCRETTVGWDNGIGVRLRSGIGFRMITIGWNRNDLIKAVDRRTEVGTRWANEMRIDVEGDGEAALKELMQAGALRPATHEDGRRWLSVHLGWAGGVIREVVGDRPERLRRLIESPAPVGAREYGAYVVRKPLKRLPGGFADGRPRQFLIPEGVPLPGGDWGDHEVYLMDAGVCRTGKGQCPAYARIFQAWHMMQRNADSDRDAVIAVAAKAR